MSVYSLLFRLISGITEGTRVMNQPFTFSLWEPTDGWGCVFLFKDLISAQSVSVFFVHFPNLMFVSLFVHLVSFLVLFPCSWTHWPLHGLSVFIIWWLFTRFRTTGSITDWFSLCRNSQVVSEMSWSRQKWRANVSNDFFFWAAG